MGSTTSPTAANPLNSSSLGSGTLTLTSGVLDATSSVNFNNFLAFTAGATVVGFAGSSISLSPSIAAPVTMAVVATPTQLLLSTSVTFNGVWGLGGATAALTLSGVPLVSGSTTFNPTGTLTLTGPSAGSAR